MDILIIRIPELVLESDGDPLVENDGIQQQTIVQEISESSRLETELNDEIERNFNCGNGPTIKRLSCLSHTLQLVMGSFDSHRNAKGELPKFARSIKKARRLVEKFNTSGLATIRLVQLGGKKLLADVVTHFRRFSYSISCQLHLYLHLDH